MKKKLLVAAAALTVVGGSIGVLAQENDGSESPRTVQTSQYLSKEEALEKSFEHAQVSKDEVEVEEVEFDKDDNVPHYDIEFRNEQTEYEYSVHAENGKILDSEIDDKEAKESKKSDKEEYITEEKALETALRHAGISAENIQLEELELSKDDGFVYYEIEFKSQGADYEYNINAVTAEVLDHESDNQDDQDDQDNRDDDRQAVNETKEQANPAPAAKAPTKVVQPVRKVEQAQPAAPKAQPQKQEAAPKAQPKKQESAPKQLTMEQARDIALAHAGVSLDSVHMDDAELSEDDGRLAWEFEFASGNLENEAEIDAFTGSILDFEKEQDD